MTVAKFAAFKAAQPQEGVDCNKLVAGKLESKRAEKRWLIVSTHKANPELTEHEVAARVKADPKTVKLWLEVYKRTGGVQDQPRSGRKQILTGAVLEQFKQVVAGQQAPLLTSARTCAQLLQSELGVQASERTVRRTLSAANWKHGHGKKAIQLTPIQKQKRLAFAQKHLSRKTSFSSWMFTDSKLFQLHRTSAKPRLKVWYPSGDRPTLPIVKKSRGLHT